MLGYLTGFDNDLFEQFERMHRDLDRMFGDSPATRGIRSVKAGTYPAINVGVSPEQVDVYAFVAGVDPKSLDISLQQNLLTISGERKLEEPENVEFYRQERFDGAFHRVIGLPEDLDPDKIDASYRDGVLHIVVQRREEVKPRQVEIK